MNKTESKAAKKKKFAFFYAYELGWAHSLAREASNLRVPCVCVDTYDFFIHSLCS